MISIINLQVWFCKDIVPNVMPLLKSGQCSQPSLHIRIIWALKNLSGPDPHPQWL